MTVLQQQGAAAKAASYTLATAGTARKNAALESNPPEAGPENENNQSTEEEAKGNPQSTPESRCTPPSRKKAQDTKSRAFSRNHQSSLRPSKARIKVASSAYSKCPPTGIP